MRRQKNKNIYEIDRTLKCGFLSSHRNEKRDYVTIVQKRKVGTSHWRPK